VRILGEPRNALLKQYHKIFSLEGVGITFDPGAVRAIAEKAMERGTGARGLRAVIEGLMRDVMFDIPSRTDVREVLVTPESVREGIPPLLILSGEEKRKKEA
jgi:ATP-dependent Clp protease ATP-binding subunit ClpX